MGLQGGMFFFVCFFGGELILVGLRESRFFLGGGTHFDGLAESNFFVVGGGEHKR